jgi:hypothetical protein
MRFDRSTFFARVRPVIDTDGVGVLQSQIDALNLLLDFIEADARFDGMDRGVAVAVLAYFLATVAHETTIKMRIGSKNFYVKSFQPVEEMGGTSYLNRMYDTRTDLGNTPARDGDGAVYGGDGYVQNTGKTNAAKTGRRLAGTEIAWADVAALDHKVVAAFTREGGSQRTPISVDGNTFVREHELLRVPKISYLDAMDGMLTGRYTGRKIGDYINVTGEKDFYLARRVINGITAKNAHTVKDMERMAYAIEAALTAALTPEYIKIPSTRPIELPQLTDKESTAEQTPSAPADANNESAAPQINNGAPASGSAVDFTAYIPSGGSIKGYFAKAVGGSAVGTAVAWLTGLPPEIRYGLVAMFVVFAAGAVWFLVSHHQQVFAYVTRMNEVRAQNNTANFDVQPHSTN